MRAMKTRMKVLRLRQECELRAMIPRYAALLFVAGLLVSARVFADVIPQTLYGPCGGKRVGDDCTTERDTPGECIDVYWSDAGPTNKFDEKYPPRGAELLCSTKPPRFGAIPLEPLILGFGISAVLVGTGLFIVQRRRKRLGS